MKFYAFDSNEAAEIVAMFKRKGFKRVENAFWYEVWESPYTGDRYELERDF